MPAGKKRALSPIDAAGAAVLVGLFSLFAAVVVFPLIHHQSQLQALKEDLNTSRTHASQQAGLLRDARLHLSDALHVLTGSTLQLQGQEELNNRLAEVTKFAKSCGLAVDGLSPGTAASGNDADRVPVRMVARGSFRACFAFLHGLHAKYADMTIIDFELSDNPLDVAAGMRAQFDLVWFVRPGSVANTD